MKKYNNGAKLKSIDLIITIFLRTGTGDSILAFNQVVTPSESDKWYFSEKLSLTLNTLSTKLRALQTSVHGYSVSFNRHKV